MEGAVTVTAALLMTFAGYEMVQAAHVSEAHATASTMQPNIGGPVRETATATECAHPTLVSLPHVDEARGWTIEMAKARVPLRHATVA